MICASLNAACVPPTDYCSKCSHAYWPGSGTDSNGKLWKFQFNPQHGPIFLRQDGEPLKNQPGEKSGAWQVFKSWHMIKKEKDDGTTN